MDEPEQEERTIGTATLQPDGTIRLFLVAVADDGTRGEAMIVVGPDEERYQSIRDHLGDMQPGDSVFVKPFPPSDDVPSR